MSQKLLHSRLSQWSSGKESACLCRRHGFDPWSGKIPHATVLVSLCSETGEATARTTDPGDDVPKFVGSLLEAPLDLGSYT